MEKNLIELLQRVSKLEGEVHELKGRLHASPVPSQDVNAPKTVFNAEEASRYLGISQSTLYKLSSDRSIPHSKPNGKIIYFHKNDLDEWMKRSKNRSSTPTTNENENNEQ